LLASAIGFAAKRARSLSTSGAVAATVVGALAVAAGWNWGGLLVLYFATSTALSHWGRHAKEQRTSSMVAKTGARDARQVFANGATFALASVLGLLGVPWAFALGAGSLAASASDTWATEIGTLYGREPRSILTGRIVSPGTSGGISLFGCMAALIGAGFIATAAYVSGASPGVARGVAIGGVCGSLVDSLVGATVQHRRWCEVCERETERDVHDCGRTTNPLRGLFWMDNDVVNLLASAAGGVIAALFY
jgi:uncharacterized protein (TIGR00297 family)